MRPPLTEKQAAAWPEAIAELKRYGTVPSDPASWSIHFADEVREGRGHYIDATFVDGEVFAQILMDVYGYPRLSIASLDWMHASDDDECGCGHCENEREENA